MYLGHQFDGSKSGLWNLHHYLVVAAKHAHPDDVTIHGWRNLPFEDVTYSIEVVEHELFTHVVKVELSNNKLHNREACHRHIKLPNLSQYIRLTSTDFSWYVKEGWDIKTSPELAIETLLNKLSLLGIVGDHLQDIKVKRWVDDEGVHLTYSFVSYSFDWTYTTLLPKTANGVSEDVVVSIKVADTTNSAM